MKFDLTLATVLVFLVPGGLLLLGMPTEAISAVDRWHIASKPTDVTQAGIVLAAIFFCGSVIDSLRIITVQPLVSYFAKDRCPALPTDYFKLIDKDSIVVFELINEKAFEYLRLNQNIALALFALFVLWVGHTPNYPCVVALFLSVVWVGISVRCRIDLYAALDGFVKAHTRNTDGEQPAGPALTAERDADPKAAAPTTGGGEIRADEPEEGASGDE